MSGNDFEASGAMPAPIYDMADELLFSAHITPNRSLGQSGFLILMICISVISFGTGVAFLLLGAWPIMFFFGVDVLLLYWGFRINYRRARACEEIVLTPTLLRVRRINHRGDRLEWSCNPLWVRLERREIEDYGLERLDLVCSGKRFSIANDLGAGEKAGFADALAQALQAAKRGPRYDHAV
jgi:uncharacterized membrane protein